MLLQKRGRSYDQVANKDLQDLRPQACPSREHLLQDTDQEMSQRRADERSVDCHFGHARAEVMSVLANIMRNPRCKDFLQCCQRSGREHFCAQRIPLELLKIGLIPRT